MNKEFTLYKIHRKMNYKICLILIGSIINVTSTKAQYRELFDKYPFSFLQQTDSIYKKIR